MRRLDLGRTATWLGWGTIMVLATLTSLFALRFLSFNPEALTEELRPNLLNHPIQFYAHVLIAPFALLVGVWQFLPATHRNFYHRWAGRLYVMCVVLASIAGFFIAVTTAAGMLAGSGFMILAVLWLAATAKALFLARAGDFEAHRAWMIRSYALTCAAITLRIIVPIGITVGAGFATSYIVASWACWILNLLIAEWIVRRVRVREVVPLRPIRSSPP